MLSKIPIAIDPAGKEDRDKEVLRWAIIAELDAINLYEQMAALVRNDDIRMILLDVAREEKTHVGEFQAMLLKVDSAHAEELKAGEREVKGKN